jgi:PTS system galactitol-specific IIC component
VPFAIVTNWVIDRIPGLRDLDADPETIRKNWASFGEPVILGLVIGIILGLLGFYNAGDFQTALVKSPANRNEPGRCHAAAAPYGANPMEGLSPSPKLLRDFMQKRASGREIYIGLDSAILIGHPAAISSSRWCWSRSPFCSPSFCLATGHLVRRSGHHPLRGCPVRSAHAG